MMEKRTEPHASVGIIDVKALNAFYREGFTGT